MTLRRDNEIEQVRNVVFNNDIFVLFGRAACDSQISEKYHARAAAFDLMSGNMYVRRLMYL